MGIQARRVYACRSRRARSQRSWGITARRTNTVMLGVGRLALDHQVEVGARGVSDVGSSKLGRCRLGGDIPSDNVDVVSSAYDAYSRGDMPAMLEYIHPDLEWTYLDPSVDDPEPAVCHGRSELAAALSRYGDLGLRFELEEIAGNGARVMVVTSAPGIDALRSRTSHDRSYSVFTVRDGRVVALRDCRSREEAAAHLIEAT